MNLIRLIDRGLDRFLPSGKTEPAILHRAMRYSVFPGGKRIRPVVLIEATIACGGDPRKAVAAGCAVEFIHAYSLIHDDLPSMDDDDYRRGKPSCHKKFGEANAILAGDALLTLAFNILAEEYPPRTGVEMIRELSCAIGSLGMVGGQALDIMKGKSIDNINYLKTAKLFGAAACLGAISARAEKKEIIAMRKYGINLGMAFQAADDMYDGESYLSVKKCGIFVKNAKDSLRIFGKKADNLTKIVEHVCGAI